MDFIAQQRKFNKVAPGNYAYFEEKAFNNTDFMQVNVMVDKSSGKWRAIVNGKSFDSNHVLIPESDRIPEQLSLADFDHLLEFLSTGGAVIPLLKAEVVSDTEQKLMNLLFQSQFERRNEVSRYRELENEIKNTLMVAHHGVSHVMKAAEEQGRNMAQTQGRMQGSRNAVQGRNLAQTQQTLVNNGQISQNSSQIFQNSMNQNSMNQHNASQNNTARVVVDHHHHHHLGESITSSFGSSASTSSVVSVGNNQIPIIQSGNVILQASQLAEASGISNEDNSNEEENLLVIAEDNEMVVEPVEENAEIQNTLENNIEKLNEAMLESNDRKRISESTDEGGKVGIEVVYMNVYNSYDNK